MHTAYYMGGTIMAGRWVCCNQPKIESHGCVKAKHTTVKRTLVISPHGTKTFSPPLTIALCTKFFKIFY